MVVDPAMTPAAAVMEARPEKWSNHVAMTSSPRPNKSLKIQIHTVTEAIIYITDPKICQHQQHEDGEGAWCAGRGGFPSFSLNDWKMMKHFHPDGLYVYNVIYRIGKRQPSEQAGSKKV